MASPGQADSAGRVIAGLLGYNPSPGVYSRPSRASADSGLRRALASAQPGSLAADLVAPANSRSLSRAEEFLMDHGMRVKAPIGEGFESVVFDVAPVGNAGQRQVFKLGSTSNPEVSGLRYDLPDIPGVAHHWASGADDNLRFGLQARAQHVAPDALTPAQRQFWTANRNRLLQGLEAQGYRWSDHGLRNFGIMPDGGLSVIDGRVLRTSAPSATEAEALKLLRATGMPPVPKVR